MKQEQWEIRLGWSFREEIRNRRTGYLSTLNPFLLCPRHTSRPLCSQTPLCRQMWQSHQVSANRRATDVESATCRTGWGNTSLMSITVFPFWPVWSQEAQWPWEAQTANGRAAGRKAPRSLPPPEGEPPFNGTPILDTQGVNIHCFDTLHYVEFIGANCVSSGFPGDSVVKNPPAMQEMQVWTLRGEDPLEENMATYSSLLSWINPWTEEPGGLQSMGSQRVDTTQQLSSQAVSI